MPEQSYAKHTRVDPLFHIYLIGSLLLIFLGSLVNLYKSIGNHARLYSASLIVALSVVTILIALFARVYALKAQDRAIRAEENLRHFALTGKLLDARLTLRQIVGLRFASDGEFPELARRAAAEGLSEKDVKGSVKLWRPDYNRL